MRQSSQTRRFEYCTSFDVIKAQFSHSMFSFPRSWLLARILGEYAIPDKAHIFSNIRGATTSHLVNDCLCKCLVRLVPNLLNPETGRALCTAAFLFPPHIILYHILTKLAIPHCKHHKHPSRDPTHWTQMGLHTDSTRTSIGLYRTVCTVPPYPLPYAREYMY